MGGNKVLFGNVYSTEGDLPSNRSTYHGMFDSDGSWYRSWIFRFNMVEIG